MRPTAMYAGPAFAATAGAIDMSRSPKLEVGMLNALGQMAVLRCACEPLPSRGRGCGTSPRRWERKTIDKGALPQCVTLLIVEWHNHDDLHCGRAVASTKDACALKPGPGDASQ